MAAGEGRGGAKSKTSAPAVSARTWNWFTMSKVERMVRWRQSRELLDPEADAVLATPSSSGGKFGPHGTPSLSAQSRHGTPYWTTLVHDETPRREGHDPEPPPATSSTTQNEAVSLHLALAAASNEIDRLTLALETTQALRDVAKTRVEEAMKHSLISKAKQDTAEAARAESESAMRAAHASSKAHENECHFLAARLFDVESETNELLRREREKLAARWEETQTEIETELLEAQVREKNAEEQYDDIIQVICAERNRWTAEKETLLRQFDVETTAWAAERAALIEALELTDGISSNDEFGTTTNESSILEQRRAAVLSHVATAVAAERAKVFADYDLENTARAADLASAEALFRGERRAWQRREDTLLLALTETRVMLDAAEAARDAYERAAVTAVQDAELSLEEARLLRLEVVREAR